MLRAAISFYGCSASAIFGLARHPPETGLTQYNRAMPFQLAQVNIGRLLAPIDDPRIASFVAQLDTVNALAESAPGFVWRLQSESGNATDIAYSDDPFVIVNMSVWESISALQKFTYGAGHSAVFRERARWFQKMSKPSYCLWWVPAGHRPPVAEARERLLHYQEHGATPHAFWFSQPYPAPAEILAPV
jgi:hypothetical protein